MPGKLARPKRFELLTPKFVVWCSIQLSYGRLADPDRKRGGGRRPLATEWTRGLQVLQRPARFHYARPAMKLKLRPALLIAIFLAESAVAQPYSGAVKAAENGDPHAQFMLALMYDTGDGVPRDYVNAVKWFRRAAEGGYDVAQAKLGLMYLVGWGVLPNTERAVHWYRLAAEQGYVIAERRMAMFHAAGTGVVRSMVDAHMWASLAARQGDALAAWLRDRYAARMTRAEVAFAERRARRWRPKH